MGGPAWRGVHAFLIWSSVASHPMSPRPRIPYKLSSMMAASSDLLRRCTHSARQGGRNLSKHTPCRRVLCHCVPAFDLARSGVGFYIGVGNTDNAAA